MAIYFYYGEEDFLIEQALNKLKKGLDKNFASMNCKIVDTPNFADLMNELQSQSMMFGKKLTVIDCLEYMATKKKKNEDEEKNNTVDEDEDNEKTKIFDDKQLKEIEKALESNSDNVDIVFRAIYTKNKKDEIKKVDTRKKIFKILSKYNAQEFKRYPTYDKNFPDVIKNLAKSKGLKIDNTVAEFIIDILGNKLKQIDSEFEKLKLFVYPEKTISIELAKEILTNNEDIFKFTSLIMNKNYDKAIFEYQNLLKVQHYLKIMAVAQTMIRQIILLKLNKNKSNDELAKILGVTPGRVYVLSKEYSKVELKHLVKLKENLTNAEYNIKTGQTANPENEVISALIR